MGSSGVMMCSLGKLTHSVYSGRYCAYVKGRKGELVTSARGKVLQRKVWVEMMEVLRKHVTHNDEYLMQ
jgi:hypothetical protein